MRLQTGCFEPLTDSLPAPDRGHTLEIDTRLMRRPASIVVLLCALLMVGAVAGALAARTPAPAGSLSVEGGKGVVVVRGNGGLLGRLGKGSVELVDLTPTDQWKPTLNGVTRSRRTLLKGSNISFRILGGDYRVTVKGEEISISARGTGVATLLGIPGLSGDTGIYASDVNADCEASPDQCQPIPTVATRVTFGGIDTTTSTASH
jgi:hypothetical protein